MIEFEEYKTTIVEHSQAWIRTMSSINGPTYRVEIEMWEPGMGFWHALGVEFPDRNIKKFPPYTTELALYVFDGIYEDSNILPSDKISQTLIEFRQYIWERCEL